MSRSKSKALIAIVCALLVVATVGGILTYAWFRKSDEDFDNNVDHGSIIRQYFHCGTGTEDDPFVITRPIHYYHLVELYQRKSGFAAKNYYFQLGYQLIDNDENYYVYDCDPLTGTPKKDGDLKTSDGYAVSTTLNMNCYGGESVNGTAPDGEPLLPVGTSTTPFAGTFNGNGLSLSNVHIRAKEDVTVGTETETYTTADIGLFGYIGMGYWIETEGNNNGKRYVYVTHVITPPTENDPGESEQEKVYFDTSINVVLDTNGHKTEEKDPNGFYIVNNVSGEGEDAKYTPVLNSYTGEKIYFVSGTVKDLFVDGLTIDLTDLDPNAFEAQSGLEHNSETTHTREIAGTGSDPATTHPVLYVGYVAGHITSSSYVKDVYVNNATVLGGVPLAQTGGSPQTPITLTGYSYFGCVEDTETNGLTPSLTEMVKEIRAKGDDNGFGGSMDMKDVFTRLVQISSLADDPGYGQYISSQTFYIDELNGGEKILVNEVKKEASYTSDDNYHFYYYSTPAGGSFNISSTNRATSLNGTSNIYECLYGASKQFPNTVSTFILKSGTESASGFFIKDGANYLHYDSVNGLQNSTVADTLWFLDGSNHLYAREIFTAPNGDRGLSSTKYYLNRANDNTLTVSTTASTTWTKTADQLYCTVNDIKHNLFYSNGTWKLGPVTVITDGNGNYLRVTGTNTTNFTNTTNIEEATQWTFSTTGTNPSGYISAVYNGTTVYLRNNNGTLRLTTSTDNRTSWSNNGTNFSSTTGSWYFSTTYYLIFNTNWSLSTTASSNSKIASVNDQTVTLEDHTETFRVTEKTVATEKSGYDTYFPLRVDKDENGAFPSDFAASEKNTGYIVSGANIYDSTSSGSNTDFQKSAGDIRVAGWPISNIFTSYANGAYKTVYTVDGSGNHALTDAQKGSEVYVNAAAELLDTLNGATHVFGLHFMDALISKDHLITVPQATILGKTYYNYQLPEDCIDFHTVERGTISFFAGTYFSGNNTFFSLHEIKRDENNDIESIWEIKKVYGKYKVNAGGSYVLDLNGKKILDANVDYLNLYTDGTRYFFYDNAQEKYFYFNNGVPVYTDSLTTAFPTSATDKKVTPSTNDYEMLFDLSWITNPTGISTDSKMYYFEIPCNKGEYALGSVAGKAGAYLVYLDIGTNGGNTIQAIVSTEGNVATDSFRVDYRSAGDPADDASTTDVKEGVFEDYAILQFAVEFPANANRDNFSINVNYDSATTSYDAGSESATFAKGLYTITVNNNTGQDVTLFVFLCDDDDDAFNEFPYAYEVIFSNSDSTGVRAKNQKSDGTIFKSVAGIVIPASGSESSEINYLAS